nr:isoform 3 of probable leucine-rich repeat receptor-like protein kinase [Quercus suber]
MSIGVVLVSLSSSFVTAAAAAARDEVGKEWKEAEALLKWKASLDNQSQSLLPSWGGGGRGHPCNWVGIACDESGSLTHLNLSSVGLRGTLYKLNFSSFTNLLTIDLPSNSLYGNIPDQIDLNLAENNLSGLIPTQLGACLELLFLNLSKNILEGRIPSRIGSLQSLENLDLSWNMLIGEIPPQLGDMLRLEILYLSHNNLSGSMPSTFDDISSLTSIDISYNKLEGPIPNQKAFREASDEAFRNNKGLCGNATGLKACPKPIQNPYGKRGNKFPDSSNWTSLAGTMGYMAPELAYTMEINENGRSQNPSFSQTTCIPLYSLRTGVMPSKEFGVLFNLSVVLVSLSYFAAFSASSFVAAAARDEVGKEWKEAEALLKWKASLDNQSQSLLPSWGGGGRGHPCNWVGIACDESGSLTHLNLSSFGLRGTLYKLSFSSFTNLLTINLRNNSLYGNIPDQIGNISKLTYLDLGINNLSGPIPTSIGNLSNLSGLVLHENHLSGSLPLGIGKLKNLGLLLLASNNLSGSITQVVGTMRFLWHLDLSENFFTGAIPTSIGNLSNLGFLFLSGNYLTGSIPEELGSLTHLNMFQIVRNNISGAIPASIGNLANMENLNLAENNLSGLIPTQLGECSELLFLNLSKNILEGRIPSSIGSLQSLENLDLSWNMLTGEIPPQLGDMLRLEILYLSHNNLSGSIPSTFDDISSLTSIDISYNELEGPIPNQKAFREASDEAFRNNKGLCGNATGLKACPKPIQNPYGKRGNKFPDSSNWTSLAGTMGYMAPELAYTMEINENLAKLSAPVSFPAFRCLCYRFEKKKKEEENGAGTYTARVFEFRGGEGELWWWFFGVSEAAWVREEVCEVG